VRGWRTIYHANGHQKKAVVAILMSEKLDFKPKTVIRDEEGIYHNNVVYQKRSNNCKYLCPLLESGQINKQLISNLKRLIDNNTIIVGDFNTSLIAMDRSSKQKSNKKTVTHWTRWT